LTDLPVVLGDPARRRKLNLNREIDMNKQISTAALDRAEGFFAGIFSLAVIALVAAGTIAMCAPGAVGLLA
jgi:hypothetical protein